MKILLISQYFWPEPFSNNEIAKALIRKGHSVNALTCVPNYPAGEFYEGYSNTSKRCETWEGVTIQRAWTWPRKRGGVNLLANYAVFPISASLAALRKTVERPDVTFVSMPSPVFQALVGIILKKTRGIPTVYWVQDIWPESAIFTLGIRSRMAKKILHWVCGWIYRKADLILVQSCAFPRMIERFGVPAHKIRVFPNTSPEIFAPVSPEAAPDERPLLPESGFRLMFAGNIGESQDFDTLLDAAELLKEKENLHWIIIGSGRDLDRVTSEVTRRGLNERFRFLGRFPETRMPYFFAHADAMLVSLKDNEIFRLTVPYKVQCYMACAKPIVASLSGEGARIIRESKSGIVANAQTPKELADKIEKITLLSDEERIEMGLRGRMYFEQYFNRITIYNKLEEWLEEITHVK